MSNMRTCGIFLLASVLGQNFVAIPGYQECDCSCPPTPVPQRIMAPCQLDVVIMMNGAACVKPYWLKMQDTARQLASRISRLNGNSRFTVVSYSDDIRTGHTFSNSQEMSAVHDSITRMKYQGNGDHVERGLDSAVSILQRTNQDNGKLVIIITNSGLVEDEQSVKSKMDELEFLNADVFVHTLTDNDEGCQGKKKDCLSCCPDMDFIEKYLVPSNKICFKGSGNDAELYMDNCLSLMDKLESSVHKSCEQPLNLVDCSKTCTCNCKRHDGSKGIHGQPGKAGRPGPQGISGNDGPSGAPGKDGRQGTPGTPAKDGLNSKDVAPNGRQGLTGPDGKPGPDGNSGKLGDGGVAGSAGSPGKVGERGLPGADGMNGMNGQPGMDGPTGDVGRTGEPGLDGQRGPAGQPGRNGQSYSNGTKGRKGRQGKPGPPGPDGDRGDPGCKAENGAPGAEGPRGVSGIDGRQGPPGRPGARGKPGMRGVTKSVSLDRFKMLISQEIRAKVNRSRHTFRFIREN